MPYKQETVNSPRMPFIYNVEQAVGTNSPNAREDVKLVQYLLAGVYGPASLQVDGWIGPVTTGFIERFQQDSRKAGNNVLADGRVDKAFSYTSKISQTVYTIILLNMACRTGNPAWYNRLPEKVQLSAAPRPNPYNPARPAPGNGSGPPPGGFNPGMGDPKYGQRYIVDQKIYKVLAMTVVITYWSDGTITQSTPGAQAQYMV
jgi:hypothetical protein